MSRDNSPGAGRILSFLFAFTVLFVFVFGLGVFVGKRLGRQELKITNSFGEATPEPAPEPVEEPEERESGAIAESPSAAIEEAALETPPPSEPPRVDEKKDAEAEVKMTEAPKSIETAAPVKQDEKLAEVTREIQQELEKKRAAQKEEAKTVKPASPQIDPAGAYTVQIGSFQDQKQANSLASYLKSKGYPVFIKSMTSPDNEKWYRVRVGTFKDIESAKAYGESLKNKEPKVTLVFITVNY